MNIVGDSLFSNDNFLEVNSNKYDQNKSDSFKTIFSKSTILRQQNDKATLQVEKTIVKSKHCIYQAHFHMQNLENTSYSQAPKIPIILPKFTQLIENKSSLEVPIKNNDLNEKDAQLIKEIIKEKKQTQSIDKNFENSLFNIYARRLIIIRKSKEIDSQFFTEPKVRPHIKKNTMKSLITDVDLFQSYQKEFFDLCLKQFQSIEQKNKNKEEKLYKKINEKDQEIACLKEENERLKEGNESKEVDQNFFIESFFCENPSNFPTIDFIEGENEKL